MIRSEKGIAIIMVLWIVTILVALVISFSFLIRTEARSTIFFKEGVQKRFIAEAGMERAILEIFHRQTYREQAVVVEGNEVVRIDGRSYTGRMETGSYKFRLLSESGKIDINKMSDLTGIVLKNLLLSLDVPQEKADIIVDSILDWTDSDNLRRLNGAEDEILSFSAGSLPSEERASRYAGGTSSRKRDHARHPFREQRTQRDRPVPDHLWNVFQDQYQCGSKGTADGPAGIDRRDCQKDHRSKRNSGIQVGPGHSGYNGS